MTGQAVFLELTLLASVTHKKNPYLVNVAFAVGRLFTKLCPVKLTSKAFKMFFLLPTWVLFMSFSLRSNMFANLYVNSLSGTIIEHGCWRFSMDSRAATVDFWVTRMP